MLLENPYSYLKGLSLELIKAIASSTLSAVTIGKMGPNISSSITASFSVTSVITCRSRNFCAGSRSCPITILPKE